ncbi:hypothetical protein [Saccharothrix lopnurensis]|uniref:Uncharacterized protein n=1 Tax=Saccharothrix lopnurensis TaxID=1670621 RepID=A0ABW1PH54_9PSEU
MALAQLLIKNSSILLLDEPIWALDDVNTGVVIDITNELAVAGVAVIVTTYGGHIRVCADIGHEFGSRKR